MPSMHRRFLLDWLVRTPAFGRAPVRAQARLPRPHPRCQIPDRLRPDRGVLLSRGGEGTVGPDAGAVRRSRPPSLFHVKQSRSAPGRAEFELTAGQRPTVGRADLRFT